MGKEHPVFEVHIEKVLKDTGSPGKPFYSKVAEYKRFKIFGILISKVSITGEFPDPDEKSGK
jgi:hypothetical protein